MTSAVLKFEEVDAQFAPALGGDAEAVNLGVEPTGMPEHHWVESVSPYVNAAFRTVIFSALSTLGWVLVLLSYPYLNR